MIPTANTSISLVKVVRNAELFDAYVHQLKKDFNLAGHSIEIDANMLPNALVQVVHFQIKDLISTNFDAFLQVLYRVDVEERILQSNSLQDAEELVVKATYEILKREWEKVYFRNRFS